MRLLIMLTRMAHTGAQHLVVPFVAVNSNRLVRAIRKLSFLALWYFTTYQHSCLYAQHPQLTFRLSPEVSRRRETVFYRLRLATSFTEYNIFFNQANSIPRLQRISLWTVPFARTKETFWKEIYRSSTEDLLSSAMLLGHRIHQKRHRQPQNLTCHVYYICLYARTGYLIACNECVFLFCFFPLVWSSVYVGTDSKTPSDTCIIFVCENTLWRTAFFLIFLRSNQCRFCNLFLIMWPCATSLLSLKMCVRDCSSWEIFLFNFLIIHSLVYFARLMHLFFLSLFSVLSSPHFRPLLLNPYFPILSPSTE